MAPVIDEVDYSLLPEHMQDGTRAYIEQGRLTGGFLRAVLENDLVRAFGFADDINYSMMGIWARWLFNEAPSRSWGSSAKVEAWIAKFEDDPTECAHEHVEKNDDGLIDRWFACQDCHARLVPERNEDGGTDWVAYE